jgi:hypothetical protein
LYQYTDFDLFSLEAMSATNQNAAEEDPHEPCLLDLPAELLAVVAAHLPEDDELAAALTCRKLREAVTCSAERNSRECVSTSTDSVFGSVAKVLWALACGLPLESGLLARAAGLGQLEPLRFLRAQGCAWRPCAWENREDDVCGRAAAGGHLAVLRWARANGCPWDEGTCSAAAWGGHLPVLQWALPVG